MVVLEAKAKHAMLSDHTHAWLACSQNVCNPIPCFSRVHLLTRIALNGILTLKVLRGGWVALARDEDPVNGMWQVGPQVGPKGNAANGKGGRC
jgi:hypothetical protein